MTFDEWMIKKNPKHHATDDTVTLRLLRDCWQDSAKIERETCAKLCDELFADSGYHPFLRNGALNCGTAIRMLSQANEEANLSEGLGLWWRTEMDERDFWIRCVNARCVIVPVPTYSAYGDDGNTHAEQFTGLKFAALPFDDKAVGPDYYFMIEEGQTGSDRLYATPEDALVACEAKAQRQGQSTACGTENKEPGC